MKKQISIFVAAMLLSVAGAFAQDPDVLWKKNFGGGGWDSYYSATAVSDGVVAVGYSDPWSFGNGDWAGVTGKGDRDAIIVKYDNVGNVVWKKNFGGSGGDEYYSVTAVSDGIVAVGSSGTGSFGNGDWAGVTGKGGDGDAIIVKYDNAGNVVWKKNFGGSNTDSYHSVTALSDGIVAVGFSEFGSFGNGDWTGITGHGLGDAIIVKYDNVGNVVWKKNFGGGDVDFYNSVTAVSGGIVAVGTSEPGSFGNGDWAGITGKGDRDAIIVKYDNAGNVVWKKNFGGSWNDSYYSVTAVSDGVIAVGYSFPNSFGNGDWESVTGKGHYDAIIVKYDNAGNVVWKKNFGGSNEDVYNSVTAVSDGVVAVGYSSLNSFGNGDWAYVEGKGSDDAIIVKYDNVGNVVWKKNFGGYSYDYYNSVTAISNSVVAVGYSGSGSFDNHDWEGVTGKGDDDAIIVKYVNPFVPVTNITGVPTTATATLPLTLTGTVVPSDATNKTITWSVQSAGTTGATITGGNILNTTNSGTCVVLATVVNGASPTSDYTQPCTITVSKATLGGTVSISGSAVFGETLTAVTTDLSSSPTIPSLGTLSYQWRRGATNISGAINATYTLVQEDIGQQINVQVTAANCTGTVTSANTATVTKATQTAPAAPTMASNTSTSITLTTVSGCEYNINGGDYQNSPLFGGLTPSTSYSFTQRKAETATHLASPASPAASFSTDAGTAPVLGGTVTITGNAVFDETLTANTSELTCTPSGPLGTLSYVWKRNGNTSTGTNSATHTLIAEDIGCTISVTVTAANCTGSVTSNATATVTKATQTAPAAPTLADKTATSITLTTVTGCEYNIDGGSYLNSPIFTGLAPSTSYTFTQRMAETATHLASPASPAATFTTDASSAANISGKALLPDQTPLSSGEVSLYRVQSLSQYILIETVQIGSNGNYVFNNVSQGGYIVKATAPTIENALPTYYGNSENWEQAMLVTIATVSVSDIDITIILAPELPEGDSDIDGYVIEEGSKKSRSPVEDVTVYLLSFKNNAWATVATALTDVSGRFAFGKLQAGKYMTIVDAPGLKMLNSIPLDLAASDTINIVFTITDDGIETIIGTVNIVETGRAPSLQIYPNPVKNLLTIESEDRNLAAEVVKIYDLLGREVLERRLSDGKVDVSLLPPGTYILKIGAYIGKFVKE